MSDSRDGLLAKFLKVRRDHDTKEATIKKCNDNAQIIIVRIELREKAGVADKFEDKIKSL